MATYDTFVNRAKSDPFSRHGCDEGSEPDFRRHVPPGTNTSAIKALRSTTLLRKQKEIINEYIEVFKTRRRKLRGRDGPRRELGKEEMDRYENLRNRMEDRIDALDMVIECFQEQRGRVVWEEEGQLCLLRCALLVVGVVGCCLAFAGR